MATTLTPNMNLVIPGVGTENGPQYASDINSSLTIIDGHDHSPGYGTPVTPAGLNINSDLTFIGNNATNLRSIRFSSQGSALSGAQDLDCAFVVGNDLYYRDGNGVSVRITQNGAVAGTPGSIANLVSPASASYSSASKTFIWQSDTNKPANLDAASIVLRNLVTSSFGLTLSPPSLSNDYSITLPPLPGSTLPVLIDSSGTMSTGTIGTSELSSSVNTALNKAATPPTVQRFLSGSGTYTTPTSPYSPIYIRIRAIGGGGGGAGGSTASSPTGGGNTTFGAIISAGGGSGGGAGNASGNRGGAGGTATITGVGIAINGSDGDSTGSPSAAFMPGGSGGSSAFGGAGRGGAANDSAASAKTNSGSGGGGGGSTNSAPNAGGGGGGAGAYCELIITSPSATYAYAVGSGGSGSGNGGNGADGIIIVEEYYS